MIHRLTIVGLLSATFVLGSIAQGWQISDRPGKKSVEFHFDFGPDNSAVMNGFIGIDAAAKYSPAKGYGWSSGAPVNYTAPKPPIIRKRWWHLDPNFFYDEMTSDLRRDGVESENPLSFRIDIPRGRYRALVTVGHLIEPRYGIDIYANGNLVKKKIDARHWLSSERGKLHYAPGYYKRAKFSVDVGDDGLTLDFKGDDAKYLRLNEIEMAKSEDQWPRSRFKNEPLPPEHRPYRDIGGPFTKISLMGLEVYPEAPLPVAVDPETLELSIQYGAETKPALKTAVDAFNAGDFQKAEAGFAALPNSPTKGLCFLALAGRADYENGIENTRAAIEALTDGGRRGGKWTSHPRILELVETARIFLNGLEFFRDRGVPPHNGPRRTWRAVAELEQSEPEDFVYYKSVMMQGRLLIMLDPHQWAWQGQEGENKLRIVEKKYPKNRFAQFYLHGNFTASPDWVTQDYLGNAREAGRADWAAGMYSAYNLLVDVSEWWSRNKQQEDGSIGGGWGDDVELVGFFGYIGRISDGASPLSIQLARNLMDGMYRTCDEVDPVGGYFYRAADSEHTAEYTGKTLPMIMAVDFGNPIWHDRALKSAKLMKEIWMGTNQHGHFHWRSNFLGASGVGDQLTAYDSGINWRAANPAVAILRLNNNPAIRDMVLRHADSLYEDAMRTDKGKPRGIIPGDIDFETDEIGGRNVPTWYDPGDIPARGMYGFEKFHDYRLLVMHTAYRLTGDEKYLEPIRIEAQYALEYGGDDLTVKGKIWTLEAGTPEWFATVMQSAPAMWEQIQQDLARKKGEDIRVRSTQDLVEMTVENIPQIRQLWPYCTTEALATDRVYIPNAVDYILALTGAERDDWTGNCTYRHCKRDFAAAILGADPTSLTAVAYLFGFDGEKTRKIGLVPWQLELGAKYRAVWGLDENGDDRMDAEQGAFDFQLLERGQSVDFQLDTGKTYILKIVQVEPSPLAPVLADLAIGPEDVTYRADWGLLHVTVHNVGAADANEYEVVVTETKSGKQMRSVGNSLSAPLDLAPQWTRFGFGFTPTEKKHVFVVDVKSLKDQPEVTMLNNSLAAEIWFEN